MDYPSEFDLLNLEEDNRMTTLMISTSYLHNKLSPSFFWMHDIDNEADMYRLQLKYDYSNEWSCLVGGVLLDGDKPGKGFHVFENKDYLYFKLSYKWG